MKKSLTIEQLWVILVVVGIAVCIVGTYAINVYLPI